MAFLAGKRIGIAGGGIGGSAFALALKQTCEARGISPLPSITIYERDASPSARETLGYSFGVVEGLHVVRKLGIMDKVMQLQEPSSDGHFCYQNFNPLVAITPSRPTHENGGKGLVLRIMRARLQQTLLGKVPPQDIQFGKICTSAVPASQEGQPVKLTFADGSSAEHDLLVVADGANSKLRAAMLPQEQPNYAGVCMLFVRHPDSCDIPNSLIEGLFLQGRTKPLDPLVPEVRRGINFMVGNDRTSVVVSPVDKTTAMWSVTQKAPLSRANDLNTLFSDPKAAEEFKEREIPKLLAGFSSPLEPLLTLIRQTPASALVAMPARDKPPHAIHDRGVVYIGDAWHPMSPFSGAGANTALEDAWDLAQELVNGGHSNAQQAISKFAEQAAPRAAKAIKNSHILIAAAHSDGITKQLFVLVLKIVGGLLRGYRWVSSSGSQQVKETPGHAKAV